MTVYSKEERAIARLDSALCNFINAISDPYDVELWLEESRNNLKELSDAYNECHVAGVMDLQKSCDILHPDWRNRDWK